MKKLDREIERQTNKAIEADALAKKTKRPGDIQRAKRLHSLCSYLKMVHDARLTLTGNLIGHESDEQTLNKLREIFKVRDEEND